MTLTEGQEAEIRAFYAREQGFGPYLRDLFTLKWGYSYAFLTPVSSLILEALPWTLLLLGSAHVISMLFGFISGVEAAWRRGGYL